MKTLLSYATMLTDQAEFLEWLRLYTGYDTNGKERPEAELDSIHQYFIDFANKPIPYKEFSEGMWSYYVQERQLGNITEQDCEEFLYALEHAIPEYLEEHYPDLKLQVFGAWKRLFLELKVSLPANSFYKSRHYYHDEILPNIQPFMAKDGLTLNIPIKDFMELVEKIYNRKEK